MSATEQKVTPLELFFDLVFVFAFTQVRALRALLAALRPLDSQIVDRPPRRRSPT